MTKFDIAMGLIELAMIVALLLLARWLWPAKPDPVIGSELDRRWRDVEHAHLRGVEYISPRSFIDPRGIFGSPSGTTPNRADRGHFSTGNRPPNAGTSKQIERLHISGVPHASTVAMMDADCTQQERRVIHMREAGDSLALIASRLGVSVAKVRRLEKSAVDKIIAARKEPS